MARTTQASLASAQGQYIGIWIQYKGPRARTLQTTKSETARADLTASIVQEFLADLDALQLSIPGVPMVDIRVVWGTGQVRAHYGLNRIVTVGPSRGFLPTVAESELYVGRSARYPVPIGRPVRRHNQISH